MTDSRTQERAMRIIDAYEAYHRARSTVDNKLIVAELSSIADAIDSSTRDWEGADPVNRSVARLRAIAADLAKDQRP